VKIAIVTGFFAKRDMDVNSWHVYWIKGSGVDL
jgi:hypothetical protein